MTMYVYGTDGDPVGFVYETFIHDMEGTPLGRIVGIRVHRLDGSYVGDWFKDMVVRRPEGRPRTIPPLLVHPPRRTPPGTSFRRRAVVDYGYPDVFHLLKLDPSNDGGAPVRHAAE